eukprot:tig00000137_g8136.t1
MTELEPPSPAGLSPPSPGIAEDEEDGRLQLHPVHFLPDLAVWACSDSTKDARGRVEAGSLLESPSSTRFHAAVVLVDVVGSVKAAQRLIQAAQGDGDEESRRTAARQGAEALSRALNGSLSRAIRIARKHGGDVIRFLGDAILRLAAEAIEGPAREEPASDREAALESPPTPSSREPETRLGVHVALAVVGEPLGRLAAGLALAGPGEAALAPSSPATPRPAPAPTPASPSSGPARRPPRHPGRPARTRARSLRFSLSLGNSLGGSGRSPRTPAAGDESPSSRRPASWAARGGAGLLGPQRPALAGGAAVEGALRGLLPEDVAGQLAGDGRFLAELRMCTSAFVRVDGFAGQGPWAAGFPAEALAALHRAVAAVLEAAAISEGVLRSCFCDDKGFICLLTWGLAGAAHSDDPLRACLAALHIREQFAARQCGPASIGVTTGRVFAGLLGDEQRLMAKADGAIWVDAATAEAAGARVRLEALPPLAIKGADGPVAAFALRGRAARTAPVGRSFRRAVAAMGSGAGAGGPAGAGRPGGDGAGAAGAAAGADGLLLCRREALGRVAGFLAAARVREGGRGAGVLFVEGEAGAGKSLLLTEALRLAEAAALPCLFLEADPLAPHPYQPLRQLLRALVPRAAAGGSGKQEAVRGPERWTNGADAANGAAVEETPRGECTPRGADTPRALREGRWRGAELAPFLEGLGVGGAEEAALLAAFLADARAPPRPASPAPPPPADAGAAQGGEEEAEAGEGDEGAPRLLRLLTALVETVVARSGAALLVDDLHAFDSASLQLLAHLAAVPAASLLVATRPLSRRMLRLRGSPRTSVMELGPLEAEEVAEFVGRLLGVEAAGLPPWLPDELAEKSRRNPFALKEMVEYLQASGWLAVHEGRLRLPAAPGGPQAAPLAIPLPDSMERLLVARLDRLPPTPALVLKLCSALGPRFEAGLAAFALEGYADGSGVAGALQALERHGVLAASERSMGILEVRFLQSAVRDVLYKLLASEDRDRVHRRAAEFLERAVSKEGAAGQAAAAGAVFHHLAAGQPARALPHLDACAAGALSVGAYSEGLELAQRALALGAAEAGPEEAIVLARARRWQLAARALFSLGRPAEAGAAIERCLRLLGVRLAHEGPLAKALAVVAHVLRKARAGPARSAPPRPAPHRRRGPTRRGGAGGQAGEGARAGPGRRGAGALAEQRRAVLTSALTIYSHHLIHAGDALAAMYYAFLNHDLAAADPTSPLYVDACAHVYAVLAVAGFPPEKALAWVRRGDELCRTKRCERALGYLRSEQLAVAIIFCDFAGGAALAAAAAPRPAPPAPPRRPAVQSFHALQLHLAGDAAGAQHTYETALHDARASNNRLHTMWALLGWASNRLWAGVCDAATAASAEEARALFPDETYRMEALAQRAALALLRLRQGRREEAEREALAGVEALRGHRRLPVAGRVLIWVFAVQPVSTLAEVLCALLEEGTAGPGGAPWRARLEAALADALGTCGGARARRPSAARRPSTSRGAASPSAARPPRPAAASARPPRRGAPAACASSRPMRGRPGGVPAAPTPPSSPPSPPPSLRLAPHPARRLAPRPRLALPPPRLPPLPGRLRQLHALARFHAVHAAQLFLSFCSFFDQA